MIMLPIILFLRINNLAVVERSEKKGRVVVGFCLVLCDLEACDIVL